MKTYHVKLGKDKFEVKADYIANKGDNIQLVQSCCGYGVDNVVFSTKSQVTIIDIENVTQLIKSEDE